MEHTYKLLLPIQSVDHLPRCKPKVSTPALLAGPTAVTSSGALGINISVVWVFCRSQMWIKFYSSASLFVLCNAGTSLRYVPLLYPTFITRVLLGDDILADTEWLVKADPLFRHCCKYLTTSILFQLQVHSRSVLRWGVASILRAWSNVSLVLITGTQCLWFATVKLAQYASILISQIITANFFWT